MNNFIEKLDWDSQFFGFNVGKLDLSYQNAAINWEHLKDEEYVLVYIYTLHKLKSTLFYTQRINYELANKGFEDVLKYEYAIHDAIKVSTYSDIEQKETLNLALDAGKQSRFFLDPNFTPDTLKKMYRLWIDKAKNRKDYDVFMYQSDGEICGLVVCEHKKESLSIVFISVKESHRNKGIASALLSYTVHLAKQKNKTKIEVSTQGANEVANAWYIKKGFTITSKPFIYHFWKTIS